MKAILLFLICCFTTFSFAQKINIATINWPPFMYKEDGQIKGIATNVVRNIFMQADIAYDITEHSWPKAYKLLQEQENAMLYMVYKKPQREELFHWIGPIVVPYNMYFYKLKSREDIKVNSLEEAKKYRVGVIENVSNHYYLKKQGFKEGYYLQAVPEVSMNIKKLLKGRVDLIVSNEFTLPILLEKEGLPFDTVEKVYSVIEVEAGYMAFNKNTSQEILNRLDKAFNYLKFQGKLHDKINLKHLGYHHK